MSFSLRCNAGCIACWQALVFGSAPLQAGASGGPAAQEFSWRAPLALPPGASLARLDVPVTALIQLQNSAADDLRIFNASGKIVPYAILGGAHAATTAPVEHTDRYKAHPLFTSRTPSKPVPGAVEVQINTSGANRSTWVRWESGDVKSSGSGKLTQELQAVLFDTRTEKSVLAALDLDLDLPRNVLVPIEVAISADLKNWTPLGTYGPLFRFDGPDAPANASLEFLQPQRLTGRYVRLSWSGQTGVKVRSMTGRAKLLHSMPTPLRYILPAGTAESNKSITWTIPFATPIAALQLEATADNTLLPVRIAGRMDASQPWRTLTSSLVYRIDNADNVRGHGQGPRNVATPLHGVSLRALRVESTQANGMPAGGLLATVELDPLQVAFLASGDGPFVLAAGRARTPAASIDAAVLAAVSPVKLAELPVAVVGNVVLRPDGAVELFASSWLSDGTSPQKILLWAVLVLGVLVLGAVGYSLVRQLNVRR